jgi:hypothetical protein
VKGRGGDVSQNVHGETGKNNQNAEDDSRRPDNGGSKHL